jgi:hypothetical protein
MHLLSGEELREALKDHLGAEGYRRRDPEGFDALLESAGGRLGYILPRLEEKSRVALQKERKEAEAVAEALLFSPYDERLKVQSEMPTKRADLILLFERVMVAIRDLLLLSRDEGAPLLFFTDREMASTLAERAGQKRLLTTYDRVKEAKDSLTYNANVSLTVLWLFTDISTPKKG